MIEKGTKVLHKSSGQDGVVARAWKPYSVNPRLFKPNAADGHEIVTDDGLHHICIEEDFEVTE